jgi:hypothetical protein
VTEKGNPGVVTGTLENITQEVPNLKDLNKHSLGDLITVERSWEWSQERKLVPASTKSFTNWSQEGPTSL